MASPCRATADATTSMVRSARTVYYVYGKKRHHQYTNHPIQRIYLQHRWADNINFW